MIWKLSPPQYAMCPVSRHRFTNCGSVSFRNCSIRSWVSTWVSACGWNTSSTPNSSKITRASSLVPVIRFDHCSGSMSPRLRCLTRVHVGVLLRQVDQVLRADLGEQPGFPAEVGNRLVQRVFPLVQPLSLI